MHIYLLIVRAMISYTYPTRQSLVTLAHSLLSKRTTTVRTFSPSWMDQSISSHSPVSNSSPTIPALALSFQSLHLLMLWIFLKTMLWFLPDALSSYPCA